MLSHDECHRYDKFILFWSHDASEHFLGNSQFHSVHGYDCLSCRNIDQEAAILSRTSEKYSSFTSVACQQISLSVRLLEEEPKRLSKLKVKSKKNKLYMTKFQITISLKILFASNSIKYSCWRITKTNFIISFIKVYIKITL